MVGRCYLVTSESDPRDRLGFARAPLRRNVDPPRVVRVLARAAPFDRGPRKNVLVEDLETGARMVRPFRGMPKLTAAVVADVLGRFRYSYHDELALHAGMEQALGERLPGAARAEVRLTPRDRIDFLVGRVGVEAKVAMSPDAVLRQLARYAEHPDVDDLLLVTTKATHRGLPTVVGGKPLQVLFLAGSVL
jgi:hypothetical protein